MRKLLLFGLLLAACVPTTPPPSTPAGGFEPMQRDTATATPVAWIESGAALTADTAAHITRLGRLDTRGTASTVFAYAFSPDGTRLVGVNNEQLIAWDLLTGDLIFNTDRAGALNVFYAPDKAEIYTLDDEGHIRLFDADNGSLNELLTGHTQYGQVAAYADDDGWLALGGSNGDVKVWDVAERRSLVTLAGSGVPVSALAFSPDGTRLAAGTLDNRVTVWDWRNRQPVLTVDGQAQRLAFSPDGTQLAVGQEAAIDLWTVADGQRTHHLTIGIGGVRDVLLYAPGGTYLINGGAIPAVMVWNAATGAFVNTLPEVGGESVSAAFSPDGSLLATSVLGGAVTLWNMAQISADTLSRANLDFGAPQALYVDWSPDGFMLAIIEAAGTIQLWGVPELETATQEP